MDIFGTTITVLHEVYNITIFIRGVVADIKTYDADKREIQDKLEHEFVFLNSFKELFFENEDLMSSSELPTNFKCDVYIILSALKKALNEYGLLAAKHGFLDDNASGQLRESNPASFRDRINFRMRDLKRSMNWALFDKDRILAILKEYSEWTGRLRQTMSLVLLTLSAFKGTALEEFRKSRRAKDLRLQEVATRQALASRKPPEGFSMLDGHLVGDLKSENTSNIAVARYENDWGHAEDVVVECRKYSSALRRATDASLPNIGDLKAPIRQLAWLLNQSPFSDEQEEDLTATSTTLAIFSLRCIGYLDQPEQHQTLFLYQIPLSAGFQSKSSILTLNDWISMVDEQPRQPLSKPPLEERFFLAYALSLTVFNIHASGWVHKNIWSRGVTIFPSRNHKSLSGCQRYIPYLNGWGLARPTLATTDLDADNEVEPNFYRHPIRQGYPETPFTIEHDIYALGVVLLEIGLWRPIHSIFKKQIDRARTENRLPPPYRVKEALIEKARSGVPREMGNSYAKAVERCLTGDFKVTEDGGNGALLSAIFREMVVDVAARGMTL